MPDEASGFEPDPTLFPELPKPDCVFCQRIRDDQCQESGVPGVVWFEPLNPVTEGHVLVVPRRHVADALDEPGLTGEVFAGAARLAERRWLQCNLITSAGRDATQSVFHLHVHIVPRRPGDGLHLPWTGQVRS